jgi:ribose/xylose/arabinose/galactoside ABC-type transport system permease subunit
MKRARTVLAWILLAGSLVGWPLSMLTLAKTEPPFVLSLSWLAIVLSAAELLTSSQVHEGQDKDDVPRR